MNWLSRLILGDKESRDLDHAEWYYHYLQRPGLGSKDRASAIKWLQDHKIRIATIAFQTSNDDNRYIAERLTEFINQLEVVPAKP